MPETQIIPQGLNVTDSNATAIGGMVVLNHVSGSAEASITNASVDAGGNVALTALQNASIEAEADNSATSSGGSAYGTGTSLAINGTIATNIVLSSATATVVDSVLGATLAIGGDITLVGRSVEQSGVALASTSVNTRGTLHLKAVGDAESRVAMEVIDSTLVAGPGAGAKETSE